MESGTWGTVAVAVAGLFGTVVSGAIGYKNGADAVDKDYVQMAVANLDRQDASPELRKWSVDVLGKLSPVPFGPKLQTELAAGLLSGGRTMWKRIEPPAVLMEPCPDLLKGQGKAVSNTIAIKVLREYEICRIRSQSMLEWIGETNNLYDKANAEAQKIDADFRKSIGIETK